MARFVQISDFEGFIKLSKNSFTAVDLQFYIDKYEVEYLRYLLGCELYDLFIADLIDNEPQQQIYKDIFDPFCIDDDCYIVDSKGMVQMLRYFIYFEFVRDSNFKNTVTGTANINVETAADPKVYATNVLDAYNEAIRTYKAIQWYICENEGVYPYFNGQIKEYTSWL